MKDRSGLHDTLLTVTMFFLVSILLCMGVVGMRNLLTISTAESRAAEDHIETLKVCMEHSYKIYRLEWDNACEADHRNGDCILPEIEASALADRMHARKDECFR